MGTGWGHNDDEARRIAPVLSLDLRVEDGGWPEAEARRAEIEAYYSERSTQNPHMWNGPILVSRDPSFSEGRLRARCRHTDFATLLWWRDHGWPPMGAANIFSLAALEGADGGFVLGVMGAHTATAGRIYFPGGTPDPADITPAGEVDLLGSAFREMAEETGLTAGDVAADHGWTGIFDGPRVALLRRLVFAESAQELAARIRRFLASEKLPELADVSVVQSEADITDKVVPFSVAYMRARWRELAEA